MNYSLESIDIYSKDEKFIKTSFRESIKILFKKKLIKAFAYNPFKVKFNFENDYIEDYIDKAEKEALILIKNRNKYYTEYYNKIKNFGKRFAPIKKKITRDDNKQFFYYPSKKESRLLYQKKNKDKLRESYILRKNSGSLKKWEISEIAEKQKWRCFYCMKKINNKYSKDHYIPIKLGGLTTKENIVLCCLTCNISKGKKTPLDFYKYVLSYGIKGYIYENSLFFKKIKSELNFEQNK